MNAQVHVDFSPSRDAGAIQPLVDVLENELGPEFRDSMCAWLSDRHRPYVLSYWQVFVGRHRETEAPVALCGLYRHEGDQEGRYWVGWLGVLPDWRRHGVARQALAFLEAQARTLRGTELWVYTESTNTHAIRLYRGCGYCASGPFSALGLPQTAATEMSMAFSKSLGARD